jgi:hypothetical protein
MITKYALRFTALGYLTMLLLVPVAMIAWKAFENGWAPFWASVTDPDFLTALKLTLEIAPAGKDPRSGRLDSVTITGVRRIWSTVGRSPAGSNTTRPQIAAPCWTAASTRLGR